MKLLEEIITLIEKDKGEKENRYWSLEYFDLTKTLVIKPIYIFTCNQVFFMGELLEKVPIRNTLGRITYQYNSYLLILKQKYPITIEFTNNECRIKYDLKRMRKWKINKLLNGN